MKVTIRSIARLLIVALATSASIAAAAEPNTAEASNPNPPKITFENLYQMEELVKRGADPNAPIWYARKLRLGETEHPMDAPVGEYPLDAAIYSMNPDLLERLLALGAKPKRNDLGGAAFLPKKSAALAMATMLIEAGVDPNGTPDPQSIPPIILATFRENVKLVEYLLTQPKIEVDKRDIDGQTALMVAARRGNAILVEMLLTAGADPTLKDERGRTPAR